MFAIIQDSGAQFRVATGDVIHVDHREIEPGSEILFDRVLFANGRIGTPFVEGARVTGVVKGAALGDKVYVQKFKRRKNYRRRTGHRQRYIEVEIQSIDA